MNKPTKIIVHHTNGTVPNPQASTRHHTAETIDAWHKIRWPGFTSSIFKNSKGKLWHVGYHYVIEADGKTVQTRGTGEEGAHCIGMNNSSIGVCLTGNFDVEVEMPTRKQEEAFVNLYKEIRGGYPKLTARDIVPHRHYSAKSCFGKKLPDDYFKGIVTHDLSEVELTEEEEERLKKNLIEKIFELIRLLMARGAVRLTGKTMKL